MKTVIIGSGSWGSALAQVLVDNNRDVIIYGNNADEVDEIQFKHQNLKYFPEVTLHEKVHATTDINVVKDADIIVFVVPTIAIESVCLEIAPLLSKKIIAVNASKGFHPISDERMSCVIRKSIPQEKLEAVVSLIGPSHAEEVVVRMLTTISAVSQNQNAAITIQDLFSNDYLRIYRGEDEIGSEIGVALKNAIAVASGVLSGLGYGDNTRAALITRGLAEMIRYGVAFGAKQETFIGLTGVGDLIVTCTSPHSRNFQAGYEIGQKDSAVAFLANNTKTVEGIRTAKVVHQEAQKKNIDMPIIEEMYQVLYEGKKPSLSAIDLMTRDLKAER